jgi:hypothetical protein
MFEQARRCEAALQQFLNLVSRFLDTLAGALEEHIWRHAHARAGAPFRCVSSPYDSVTKTDSPSTEEAGLQLVAIVIAWQC